MTRSLSLASENGSEIQMPSELTDKKLEPKERIRTVSEICSNKEDLAKEEEDGYECGESDWRSLWLCNFIQFLCGIQFGVYFTSMWPYLSGLDHEVAFSFVGIITSVYSVGQSLASPAFGWWSQKTRSTKGPVAFGLILTAVGNLIYALLPTINTKIKWFMLLARLIVGLGSGNLGVLRAYTSTASTSKDRNKAMALGIAAFVFGQSMGPAIQAMFSPIKEKGFFIGTVQLNMYTIPAYFMIILSIVSTLLTYMCFEEHYAGILVRDEKEVRLNALYRARRTDWWLKWESLFESKNYSFSNDHTVSGRCTMCVFEFNNYPKPCVDPYAVLPKFDKIAAIVLIYMWYIQQSSITTTEIIASPLTIAMYNWKDSEAILNNGLIQTAACVLSVFIYFAIAYTRIGQIGNRKMMVYSIGLFIIYYLINVPWPFYPEKFDYIKLAPNSTEEDTSYSGGCYQKYTWCAKTTKTPIYLYAFSVVFIYGTAFPFFATPTGTIYSKVLGPRNQGFMQGIFAFFGSVSRCIMPLVSTNLFEHWGYLWINFLQLLQYVIGFVIALLFYRRMVPLKVVPKTGVATQYKHGTFYHL